VDGVASTEEVGVPFAPEGSHLQFVDGGWDACSPIAAVEAPASLWHGNREQQHEREYGSVAGLQDGQSVADEPVGDVIHRGSGVALAPEHLRGGGQPVEPGMA